MKTTRSLLKAFSQAPSKSTPTSLSPFPTLPTLDSLSKLKSVLQEIKTPLSPSPTLPTQTPISKLNYDEDHHLQEIKPSLKTNHPEDPYVQEIMTILKTYPPNKAPTPPEESFFLPSIFLPLLRRGRMLETTGPSLKINSQSPKLFKTNRPFKAEARLLTWQEYGIAVKAIQDFRTMLEDGSPMSHNLALTVLFEEEMFDFAMAIYGDMLKRNFPRDCVTFNCVIDGLGEAGKVQDAIHLFHEMAEIGISPDTTTYTNLLNGFCKFHRMDEAFMFLTSFLKKGYTEWISLDGYIMIDGLFGAGRFEEARRYYKIVLEDNNSPDMTLYRIMIKGYADAGMINDGFEIVKEMSSMFHLFPDSYCYSNLFKYFVDVGLWNMAQIFVKDYTLKANEASHSPIQEGIIACWLCKTGFVQEAEEMVDKMVSNEMFYKVIRKCIQMFDGHRVSV